MGRKKGAIGGKGPGIHIKLGFSFWASIITNLDKSI